MLEIKNVTKIYRTKGGDVKALDNVSIRFEETGLVFLLGKSGSGKSTLLNVAGGLDAPTSGEVIVKGKSSVDFSGSDFDSYRNTFIGFIFQEYNVLNEFNVEDNVALALELQGKPKDRQKIYEILKAVELDNFAKRKPNTLSGGQKQRIAIARALVKEPQIIMADEPTGALDSATGKQVFDALKKLSETRLVIVVSHDREFAEIYGDRIVELKDGQIISDVKKVKAPPEEIGKNLTKIGEDTLSVSCGSELTEADLKAIKAFVAASEGSVIISKGQKEIAGFKKANRIDESGARERFDDTDLEALDIKQYQKGDAKFIRSRLPATKALKIGASGLKVKPFRLLLTILLSIFAFIMFGLFSTMMVYDGRAVLANSFMASDIEYLNLSKVYWANVDYVYMDYHNNYDTTYSAKFTPEEIEKFGNENAFGAYYFNERVENVSVNKESSSYYSNGFTKAAYLPVNHPLRNKIIAGSYPEKSEELLVSDFFLESAMNAAFTTTAADGSVKTVLINSANDLIGQKIMISGNTFTVSGIFAAGEIPSKYDELKNTTSASFNMTQYYYQQFLSEGLHTMVFFAENFKKDYPDYFTEYGNDVNYFEYTENSYILREEISQEDVIWCNSFAVYDTADYKYDVIFLNGSTITGNQIAVDFDTLYNAIYSTVRPLVESGKMDYEELQQLENAYRILVHGVYDEEIFEDGNYTQVESEPTAEMIAQAKDYIKELCNKLTFQLKLYEESYNFNSFGYTFFSDVEVVGYYLPQSYRTVGIYCSQSLFDQLSTYPVWETITTKYEKSEDETYDFLYLPLEKNETAFLTLIDSIAKNPVTDVEYVIQNALYENVRFINEMVNEISMVFLVIGIILAVFAALLLFNFITISISNKKKEIGILRAVGARGLDVFKIFFSESGIIVGICLVLALIGSIVATSILNNVLKTQVGLDVTLFVFGAIPTLLMVGIAVAVALISTFLPVYFAARKKPVDSIRAL